MGMVCNFLAFKRADLDQYIKGDAVFSEFLYDEENQSREVTLDKSWQTIHYALTGTEWDASSTLGSAIMGGTEFGDDVGYGSARFHGETAVALISTELDKISKEQFIELLKSRSFEGVDIYCFNHAHLEDEIEYSGDYFESLKKVYHQAAVEKMCVVVYVN